MNKINFSHQYTKMPSKSLQGAWKTHILEIFTTTKEELSPGFIKFDTTILNSGKQYQLPPGKLLVIMLLTGTFLWQTVRRYTPEKERYYRSLRGQEVEIVIEET